MKTPVRSKTLVLFADFPAKKNRLRVTPRGGAYTKQVRETMTNLETQVRAQWGPAGPIRPSYVIVEMFIINDAKDIDGIWTTTVDALKKGGVIHDDSIRSFNPTQLFAPATLVTDPHDERVVITLTY